MGESVEKPLKYFENNLLSTIVLLRVMEQFNVHKLVFSSSATVYGAPTKMPLTEEDPIGGTTNPYGATKFMMNSLSKIIVWRILKWQQPCSVILIRLARMFPFNRRRSSRDTQQLNAIYYPSCDWKTSRIKCIWKRLSNT